MLAYRLRYYTGILTYLLFVSVHTFIWLAIYRGKGEGATVRGFTLEEMVTYVAIGWVSRSLYFSNIDETIDDLVRTGHVSIFLLRPVNFQLMMLFQAVGESLFRLLFFSLPITIVILAIFPVSLPASAPDALLFLCSTAAGFLVLVQLNFLVGLLAFVLKSTQGIMRAKYYMVQLFSGLLLPLSFFPSWAEAALNLMPFKVIAYVPLQFYLGKIPANEMIGVFANQIFWILFLTGLGVVYWQRAMAKLTLQGG